MSEFTPGPWNACAPTEGLHAIRWPNGRIVADVGYSGSLDGDAANAHLMAASPELAAALLAILREVDANMERTPFSADSYLPAHLIEQARAALEKAGIV